MNKFGHFLFLWLRAKNISQNLEKVQVISRIYIWTRRYPGPHPRHKQELLGFSLVCACARALSAPFIYGHVISHQCRHRLKPPGLLGCNVWTQVWKPPKTITSFHSIPRCHHINPSTFIWLCVRCAPVIYDSLHLHFVLAFSLQICWSITAL